MPQIVVKKEIKEVLAGDIAAAIGLKDVTTGDTLCAENQQDRVWSGWSFPSRLSLVAVEPGSQADQGKRVWPRSKLAQEGLLHFSVKDG